MHAYIYNMRPKFNPQTPKEIEISNIQTKSLEQIYHEQVSEGLIEYHRSDLSLFISAITAGLEVGFSLFLIGIFTELFSGHISSQALHVITAFAYPLGFIFVVMGKSSLFTEHTTLAVLPVLNKNKRFIELLKIWGIIYGGNLVGGYIMSFILIHICSNLHIISTATFAEIAHHFTEPSSLVIIGSGILAGWLMGLLSWLATSAQDTTGKIIIVYMITAAIGMGSLHHCIVGSIEVFSGFLTSDDISLFTYFRVQVMATIGNIIGGVVFVSILKNRAIQK